MATQADFKVVLQEVLAAAKEAALESAQKPDDPFESGHVMAYYDVLTVAIEQAEVMDIPLEELGLGGFDPDELLKPRKKAA